MKGMTEEKVDGMCRVEYEGNGTGESGGGKWWTETSKHMRQAQQEEVDE